MDLKCCGSCCGLFSLVAIIFLTGVSFSIKAHSPSFNVHDSQRESIASAVGYAAVIYGVFFVLSMGCSLYAARYGTNEEEVAIPLKSIDIESELLADAQRV